MILYTLSNSSLSLDVYEDKVIITPRAWKSVLSKQWASAKVIQYQDLKHVEIEKRYWPMRHRLKFAVGGEHIVFEYRHLEAFFDQLKIFFERQILKYHISPKVPEAGRLLSISELIDEKKRKKTQLLMAA